MTDTAYVSRRLPLSHQVAAEALDKWLSSLRPSFLLRQRAKESRHLRLDRRIGLSEDDDCVLGRLKASLKLWGKTTRVELEVRKWSAETCEVGLQPSTTHWPVLTDRYLEVASQIVEALTAELILISVHVEQFAMPTLGQTYPIASAADRPLALVS